MARLVESPVPRGADRLPVTLPVLLPPDMSGNQEAVTLATGGSESWSGTAWMSNASGLRRVLRSSNAADSFGGVGETVLFADNRVPLGRALATGGGMRVSTRCRPGAGGRQVLRACMVRLGFGGRWNGDHQALSVARVGSSELGAFDSGRGHVGLR